MRLRIKNKTIVRLWAFVWRRRLDDCETVAYVRGWRGASVDRASGRQHVSIIFDWEWKVKKKLGLL